MSVTWKKHTSIFARPGGTSRGVLKTKDSWFLIYKNHEWPYPAIGECSFIEGLNPENKEDIEPMLDLVCEAISTNATLPDLSDFPCIQFGVETLAADIAVEGSKIFQPTDLTSGEAQIPINGLVWMGDISFMKSQIEEKVKHGFDCIKIKIGAIEFEEELNLLKWIRTTFNSEELELRVDANGGFSAAEAMEKLKRLSDFNIHSIEQPIATKQWDEMAQLCLDSPVPIALDEELIGIDRTKIDGLLSQINPQYIILKPSLIGGIRSSENWIQNAEAKDIGWWMTSALETNVGLNAIAQYAFLKGVSMPQGLGTGGLFTNNFDSPLYIQRQFMRMHPQHSWNFNALLS
ncbi:MAG: o-succinylbenzoate synthase [Flavobacteriales bacterium]|nr:o-succinylbenzoate synthase [Flavobacteriales bacterium]